MKGSQSKKIIVGFIVPFKPRSVSRNWILDNQLLIRTIKSIYNQIDKSFQVYIIYTDQPEDLLEMENLHYVKFEKPLCKTEDIEDYHSVIRHHSDGKILIKRFDKERKICFGISKARESGCTYIMSVDSDDLISNKIVSFIMENNDNGSASGWFIPKGYIHKHGSNYLINQPSNMWALNGSTHIVREDFLPNPNHDSMKYNDFNFFTSHGYIKTRLKRNYGCELYPIPFPAVIYVAHTSNLSFIDDVINFKVGNSFKKIVKTLLRYKRINNALKTEFNIRPT